jgi:hypothetical protein
MSKKTTGRISLIEDHDEALAVWRRERVKNLDLVHIDAHIDFGYHRARPVAKVFSEARSLKELKKGLEQSLAFRHYESDFDKQTNIGNFIYPAMAEDIVRDLYWVIPGGLKEFRGSFRGIHKLIRNLAGQSRFLGGGRQEGLVRAQLLGRKFVICVLEKLPVLRQRVLLDIDTDFMVIDNLTKAANTVDIGKRRPWIMPEELAQKVRDRIRRPEVITIAYSVNGGFTPMRYKVFGDRVARCLSPAGLTGRGGKRIAASAFFERFVSTGKKEYYQKAVRLDPWYRAADNNYGPLYLSARKFSKAKKEFLRVLSADPKNPFCLSGVGNVALAGKDFKKAKACFSLALKESRGFFPKARGQALLGLAQAEFGLDELAKARKSLSAYQALEPLAPEGYHLSALISEKERDYEGAAAGYKDALRLGFDPQGVRQRLLKISQHLRGKNDIIQFIDPKY